MPRPYSEDLRWSIIWMKECLGYQVEEITFTLNVSESSVRRYLQTFYTSGTVDKKCIGRPIGSAAMHPHEQLILMEAVLKNPEKTLCEIMTDIHNATGSTRALSSIHYYLKRNGITRKKLKNIALQRKEMDRVEFRANVCTLNPEMFVFLDESGIDKRILRTGGYSFRGTRAEFRRIRQNWGQRISVIPVVCTEGILDVVMYRGTVNGQHFLEFVDDKLAPNLMPFNGINPRSVLIMDNAAIHHTREVLDAINATGALVVLPPYSPDFMPCEGIFSQVKSWIRANDIAWQSCDDPEDMILYGLLQLSDQEIRNYITHSDYC